MQVYEHLGVRRVINASGRMTHLGGSTITPEVAAAMTGAGQAYVDIEELHDVVAAHLAEALGAEAAMVTTGAAAGIAIMVAACVAGTDLSRIHALPDPGDAPNEIIIQAGHQVDFGAPVRQMIALAGGRPRAIGSVNGVRPDHLIGAIGSTTAAFLFVQSHHCVQKGMLSLQQCIQICRERGVPVLLDAAAEDDLRACVTSGADVITFSGGKAIGGPTSGIIVGSAQLMEACRMQRLGIARPMKVGKEVMVGLWKAVSQYMERDVLAERERQRQIVDRLLTGFGACKGAVVKRLADEAGRGIERAALELEPSLATSLVRFLRDGDPAIYPRAHLLNLGIVAFDPRPLTEEDAAVIVERVHRFFNEQRNSED